MKLTKILTIAGVALVLTSCNNTPIQQPQVPTIDQTTGCPMMMKPDKCQEYMREYYRGGVGGDLSNVTVNITS